MRTSLFCSFLKVLAELRFDIPLMYAFHREQSKDVHVDLWRFSVTNNAP
jgi:predicted RNA methylase